MEWKLFVLPPSTLGFHTDHAFRSKHGTYRPKLATLVASNSDEAIRSTTTSAFATYSADNDAYIESIKTLSQLKGIGPATASLLLSCYDPAKVPFLSDQLFRYALWKRAKGQGWDRKIKYSVAEYVEMFSAVQGLRERLEKESGSSVSAMDLEKAAYVLAKEAEPGSKRYDVDEEGGKKEEVVEPQKPSKKRKSAANEDGNKKEEAGARSKAKRRR